jgi:hypothetical protein
VSQRFLAPSFTSKRLHDGHDITDSAEWSLGRVDWTFLQHVTLLTWMDLSTVFGSVSNQGNLFFYMCVSKREDVPSTCIGQGSQEH